MKSETHSSVQMKQVHSSHIHSVGYDNAANALHVEYKNGSRFKYKDVPPEKARLVMSGASIGSALHQHIKGQHDHENL